MEKLLFSWLLGDLMQNNFLVYKSAFINILINITQQTKCLEVRL